MTKVIGKVMPAVVEVRVAAYEDGWYIGKVREGQPSAQCRKS